MSTSPSTLPGSSGSSTSPKTPEWRAVPAANLHRRSGVSVPTGTRAVAWATGAHAAAHTHLRDQDRPDGLGALRQKAAEVLDPRRRVQRHGTAPSPQQRGRHCHLGDVGRGLEREYAEHGAAARARHRVPDKLR
jgi:hypothetical protein